MDDTNRTVTIEYLGDYQYKFTGNSPESPEPVIGISPQLPFDFTCWLSSGYFTKLSQEFIARDSEPAIVNEALLPKEQVFADKAGELLFASPQYVEADKSNPADGKNDNGVETSGDNNLPASVIEAIRRSGDKPTESK